MVDGGSTDDTIPILESYIGDDDLKIIKLSREEGSIPKSLNAGLAAAKGEFIARMDADDVAYKWRLNDQVYYFITHPETSLVGTGVDVFGSREGSHRSPFTHDQIKDMFLINNPFFHPTVMFRRKLIDDGLFYYGRGSGDRRGLRTLGTSNPADNLREFGSELDPLPCAPKQCAVGSAKA